MVAGWMVAGWMDAGLPVEIVAYFFAKLRLLFQINVQAMASLYGSPSPVKFYVLGTGSCRYST